MLCDYVLRDELTETQDLLSMRFEVIRKFGADWESDEAVATALGRIATDILQHLGEADKLPFFDAVKGHFARESKTDPDLAAEMLDLCVLSPSLDPDEKIRVLLALSSLSVENIEELVQIFREERRNFYQLASEFPYDCALLFLGKFQKILVHLPFS